MLLYQDTTKAILGAFFTVYRTLGYGFLEKVYQRALVHELRKRSFAVEPQAKIDVFYDGLLVGEYFADILVENAVIIEIKAAEALAPEHTAQLLNYLKATPIEVGLLINFGPKPTYQRKIFTNDHKSTGIVKP